EDGIRDFHVTGVQTCALPIFRRPRGSPRRGIRHSPPPRARAPPRGGGRRRWPPAGPVRAAAPALGHRGAGFPRVPRFAAPPPPRSEERRVGKEGRPGWLR